ncbi:hypothetical protein PQR02_38715 [Paraburkholderia sediminicola]
MIKTADFKAGMSIAVIGLGGVGNAALIGASQPALARSSQSIFLTRDSNSRARLVRRMFSTPKPLTPKPRSTPRHPAASIERWRSLAPIPL